MSGGPLHQPCVTLLSLLSLASVLGCAGAGEPLPSAAPGLATDRDRRLPQIRVEDGGHRGVVNAIQFSSDGRTLYTAGEDKVVRSWDMPSLEPRRIFRLPCGPGVDGTIAALDVSPDERWITAGGCFGCWGFWGDQAMELYVLDAESGEIVDAVPGTTNYTSALSYSPDGRLLASSGSDRKLKLWQVAPDGSLLEVAVLSGHAEPISDIAWYPHGDGIVSVSNDGLIVIWKRHPIGGWFAANAVSPDEAGFNAVVVSRVGDLLVGSRDGEIQLRDAATGKLLRVLHAFRQVGVLDLDLSPDGELVAYSTGGPNWDHVGFGTVSLSRRGFSFFRTNYFTPVLAWSPDDSAQLALSRGVAGEILVWNPMQSARTAVLKGMGSAVTDVSFMDSVRLGWSTDWDAPRDYRVLDVQNIAVPEEELEDRALSGSAIDSDVEVGVNHPSDGHVVVYGRGRPAELHAASGRIYAFRVLSDESLAISTHSTMRVIDLRGRPHRDCYGHEGRVLDFELHGDGRILVSGSSDQTIRFWDSATCQLLLSFYASASSEWIAWTPQGYFEASQGGAGLAGVHQNRGPRQTPRFLPLSEYPGLRRPEWVEQALLPERESPPDPYDAPVMPNESQAADDAP